MATKTLALNLHNYTFGFWPDGTNKPIKHKLNKNPRNWFLRAYHETILIGEHVEWSPHGWLLYRTGFLWGVSRCKQRTGSLTDTEWSTRFCLPEGAFRPPLCSEIFGMGQNKTHLNNRRIDRIVTSNQAYDLVMFCRLMFCSLVLNLAHLEMRMDHNLKIFVNTMILRDVHPLTSHVLMFTDRVQIGFWPITTPLVDLHIATGFPGLRGCEGDENMRTKSCGRQGN